MEKFPGIYEVANRLYIKMSSLIETMYKEVKDFEMEEVTITKEEVMVELDHYIQALLLRVAIADNMLDDIEISFVKRIAKHDDAFKEYEDIESGSITSSLKLELSNKCDEIIKVIPYFVKMSVMIDKYLDSRAISQKLTHSQVIYDNLIRIANYLKFVDGNLLPVEDKTSREVMKEVRKYYLSSYVKFARARKEGE